MLSQNSKLDGTSIWGFGITPGMTCVHCNIKCYAVKGAYNVFAKSCVPHWDNNLTHTRCAGFIAEMYYDIANKKQLTHVRVHTEGDFYSQEYLNKWARIARLFPDKQFYAYTKALHLDFGSLPANFKIIQSIGGEHDGLIDYAAPHAVVFDSEAELIAAGYTNCSKDDFKAADPTVIKIGLVYH